MSTDREFGQQQAALLAKLYHNCAEHGIRLRGRDRMEDTEQHALAGLTPAEKKIFADIQQHIVEGKARLGGSQGQLPPSFVRATNEEKRHVVEAMRKLTDRRTGAGRDGNDNDEIVAGLMEETQGEPVIDLHGADHNLGTDDINEKLARASGRHVTTIMITPTPAVRRGLDADLAGRRTVDVPDYLYNPATGRLDRLPGGHTNDPACRAVDRWATSCAKALKLAPLAGVSPSGESHPEISVPPGIPQTPSRHTISRPPALP